MKSIALSVLLLTFVLMNSDLLTMKDSAQIFRNSDEAWYGIVLKNSKSQSCDKGLPVTFNYSDRPNFHACEVMKFLGAVLPGSDVSAQVKWLTLFSRCAWLFLLAALFQLLLQDWLLGILFGAALLWDSGTIVYKPFFFMLREAFHQNWEPFPRLGRLMSPLQYLLPLILATWALMKNLMSERFSRFAPLAFFAVALSILWLPFYAWLPFVYLWLVLSFIGMIQNKKNIPVFIATLAVFALALYLNLQKSHFPFSRETLERSGFFSSQFQPIFISDKAFIILLVLTTIFLFKTFSSKIQALAVLAPWGYLLIQNINVPTGKEFQNFHFKDYIAPILLTTLFICIWRLLDSSKKKIAYALVAIWFALGATYFQLSQKNFKFELESLWNLPDRPAITDWIQKNAVRGHFFCSELYTLVEIETSARCSWHHLLMTYPLSDEELLKESLAQFKVEGLSPEEVQKRISRDAAADRSLGVWSFGAKADWLSKPINGVTDYSVENLNQKIIPLWMQEYQKLSLDQALAQMSAVDFFLLPKSSPTVQNLRTVVEFSQYGIYAR